MAVCRFAMLVAPDPLEPGRCVLAQVRSSLAVRQPSLAYQLNAQDGALPTVDWLGPSAFSADELLSERHHRQRPRDRAAVFLEQFLAAGPRSSREIWEAAQKAAFSAPTINRAKPLVGIRSSWVHVDGRPVSYWHLPHQEPPGRESLDPDLRRFFAEAEKKFPPRTPLDEDDFDPQERQ